MARSRILPALLAAAVVALAAGCTFQRLEPAPAPPDPALDPCASRLHDIAGSILLYYVARQAMPPDLAAIRQAGGEACPPLQCPVSGTPYAYNPDGLEIPGQPGRVVLYDATPAHNGRRWSLVAGEVSPAMPLEVRVVLLPENAGALLPSGLAPRDNR